jgi:hypothetical protein
LRILDALPAIVADWQSVLENRCGGPSDGYRLRGHSGRILRLEQRFDPLLREAHEPLGAAMNWVYWLSGLAALGIFVYLIIALFKPEYFE